MGTAKEVLKEVGGQLQAAREKKGYTLEALGDMLGGLHKQYLNGVEKGRQSLSVGRMVEIAEALGYEIEIKVRPKKRTVKKVEEVES